MADPPPRLRVDEQEEHDGTDPVAPADGPGLATPGQRTRLAVDPADTTRGTPLGAHAESLKENDPCQCKDTCPHWC